VEIKNLKSMEKSDFIKVLQKWSSYSEKYIQKSFSTASSKNINQASTYTLKISFCYGEKLIENEIFFDEYENLNAKELNDKLLELEQPFYEDVSQFMEVNWIDISKKDPPLREEVDLLVFFPTMNHVDGKTEMYRTYIIATGKYVPPDIITPDDSLNFEISRGNMRVIYWNYL
jgi:hypothetical protein